MLQRRNQLDKKERIIPKYGELLEACDGLQQPFRPLQSYQNYQQKA